MTGTRLWSLLIGAALVLAIAVPAAQTLGEKERFNTCPAQCCTQRGDKHDSNDEGGRASFARFDREEICEAGHDFLTTKGTKNTKR